MLTLELAEQMSRQEPELLSGGRSDPELPQSHQSVS